MPPALEPYLILTMVNVILALGVYLTLMSGQFSVGHAGLMGIGAYSSAVLTTNFRWPFVAAVAVAIVLAALTGVALALVTAPMGELPRKLATLAFGQTLTIVGYNITYIGGALGFSGVPLHTTLPLAAVALVLAIWVAWRFDGSRFGLAARAVRANPAAAAASGVRVRRIRWMTFGLGGALAGFAGAVYVHYALFITPDDLGFFAGFTLLAFVLFGGSEVLLGPIVGATILTLLPPAFGFATTFRFALYGATLAGVVILRPQGLITRRSTQIMRGSGQALVRGVRTALNRGVAAS
jgi:branched-chain amino acid transport system permease protein